jgi:hypothetical protein
VATGHREVRPQAQVAAARAVEARGSESGRLTRVVCPEYGGPLADGACLMVVARQESMAEGALRVRAVTVDVRLDRRAETWRVDVMRLYFQDSSHAPRNGAARLQGPALELPGATRSGAVDIWAVDGRPVAKHGSRRPGARHGLRPARELGSDEVGGPVDLDGSGGVHFANDLHRDHVHSGFDG